MLLRGCGPLKLIRSLSHFVSTYENFRTSSKLRGSRYFRNQPQSHAYWLISPPAWHHQSRQDVMGGGFCGGFRRKGAWERGFYSGARTVSTGQLALHTIS
jgi:hypothetical protein